MEKLHIDAQLALPSSVRRMKRKCRGDESIFDVHLLTVVFIAHIKSDRGRDKFIRPCPNLLSWTKPIRRPRRTTRAAVGASDTRSSRRWPMTLSATCRRDGHASQR